ncbi:hypothetical protein XAR_4168 [Xanthomonas citri pv. glycines str. 8ra]|nr:hypothetical protein XAR_4168 [Xanthomonas citri pv. glycines str. 8ra]
MFVTIARVASCSVQLIASVLRAPSLAHIFSLGVATPQRAQPLSRMGAMHLGATCVSAAPRGLVRGYA